MRNTYILLIFIISISYYCNVNLMQYKEGIPTVTHTVRKNNHALPYVGPSSYLLDWYTPYWCY